MKKFLTVLISILLVLGSVAGLTACGSNKKTEVKPTTQLNAAKTHKIFFITFSIPNNMIICSVLEHKIFVNMFKFCKFCKILLYVSFIYKSSNYIFCSIIIFAHNG